MSDKKNGLGAGSIEIDGERYGTIAFDFEGVRHTVRELSVDEGDDASEASVQPDKSFNGRLNTRMLLAKALVEPPTSIEQVGKFGNRKYLTILRHFNTLNSLPVENPTVPAGSAGPTSPGGGEPLPTA
jgi:hypothetical protein